MILSATTLRRIQPVKPFCERAVRRGMSFGLSLAGYDVRIRVPDAKVSLRGSTYSPEFGHGRVIAPGEWLLLATVEEFIMPNNVVGIVHNKSSWARRGLDTPSVVLEPGWRGHATLALRNIGSETLSVFDGDPIAQVVFHQLDTDEGPGYTGKYQGQGPDITPARDER